MLSIGDSVYISSVDIVINRFPTLYKINSVLNLIFFKNTNLKNYAWGMLSPNKTKKQKLFSISFKSYQPIGRCVMAFTWLDNYTNSHKWNATPKFAEFYHEKKIFTYCTYFLQSSFKLSIVCWLDICSERWVRKKPPLNFRHSFHKILSNT